MKQHSPSPPAPQSRTIERPDGFYWQDELGEEYGPFETLAEALQDMEQAGADTEAEPSDFESLEETEAEMGVGWIDPLTGEPGEDGSPRLEDH
jgi:hypothetical protein